jgi:hypothetical protein
MRFKLGDRVRVSEEYHWAQGALGTIAEPPDFAKQLVEDQAPWGGLSRIVQGTKGPIEFYWVCFNEPQQDADGDGPYLGGEIESNAIGSAPQSCA